MGRTRCEKGALPQPGASGRQRWGLEAGPWGLDILTLKEPGPAGEGSEPLRGGWYRGAAPPGRDTAGQLTRTGQGDVSYQIMSRSVRKVELAGGQTFLLGNGRAIGVACFVYISLLLFIFFSFGVLLNDSYLNPRGFCPSPTLSPSRSGKG